MRRTKYCSCDWITSSSLKFFKQISFKLESLVKFTTHIVNCDHICIKLHSSSSWQLTKRTCGLDDECLAWKTTASPRLVSLVKEKVYTIFIVLVALQIFLLKPACYFTTGWVTQWKSLLKKIHVMSGSYEFQAQLVFILFSGRRIEKSILSQMSEFKRDFMIITAFDFKLSWSHPYKCEYMLFFWCVKQGMFFTGIAWGS